MILFSGALIEYAVILFKKQKEQKEPKKEIHRSSGDIIAWFQSYKVSQILREKWGSKVDKLGNFYTDLDLDLDLMVSREQRTPVPVGESPKWREHGAGAAQDKRMQGDHQQYDHAVDMPVFSQPNWGACPL